jgi:tetratricopeptide (TPR) repeat protein
MLEKFNLAEPNFEEAFQLREQSGDQYGMARSYAHLGGLFRDMHRYDEAIQYLERSVEMSQQIGSLEIDASSTSVLADIYAKNGWFEKAFATMSKSIVLNDSLSKEADSKKIAQIEMQYEFDKQQREEAIARQNREFWVTSIIIVLVLVVIVATLLFILQRIRANNEQLQKEHFSLANKNLILEKKVLEENLEYKNKELTTNVMYLMKKNELLNDVSQRLLEIRKTSKIEEKEKIYKIIIELNSATNDDVWEDFELRFNEVYNDYYERLIGQFPHLTPNDRKLCAFLRLNLSSKEICAITRQSINSLNVSRARLRKKLGIDNSDTALITFLEKI